MKQVLLLRKTVTWDYRIEGGHKSEYIELISSDKDTEYAHSFLNMLEHNAPFSVGKGESFYRDGDIFVENSCSKDFEKVEFTFFVEVDMPDLKCDISLLHDGKELKFG